MRTISPDAGAIRTVRAVDEPDLVLPARPDEPIEVRLVSSEHRLTDVREHLAVYVGGLEDHHAGRGPVAGRYERVGASLTFTPAFGFVAGQAYVVRRGDGRTHRLTEFRVPARPEAMPPPARVTAVYPSGEALPENVLRFYLHFSVPMAPHRSSEFISLRDATGQVDPAAFMRFKQELWDADRRRLTILVDPGRIKRGVATNLDRGPALLEGGRYALTVGTGWPAADGSSVLQAFSKPFRVTAALRSQPTMERWTWSSPRPGSSDPLVVTFDRPFDRHLLCDAIRVVSDDGVAVVGEPRVGPAESSWSFVPDEPWGARPVRIVVDDALEDVAGNTARELLDRDLRPRRSP